MRVSTVVLMILLLGAAHTGYAQGDNNPCGTDFRFRVTKAQLLNDGVNWKALGQAMEACDQLALVSDSAYTSIIIEEAFYKAINDTLRILVGVLEQGQTLRNAMIAEQDSFIQFQKASLTKYDSLLTRSTTLVDDATKNTDRALRQIEFYKFLSAGGIVIGAAGILIGAALAL